MRERTNKRTYTTTKHITTLLLRSRVKMVVGLKLGTIVEDYFVINIIKDPNPSAVCVVPKVENHTEKLQFGYNSIN